MRGGKIIEGLHDINESFNVSKSSVSDYNQVLKLFKDYFTKTDYSATFTRYEGNFQYELKLLFNDIKKALFAGDCKYEFSVSDRNKNGIVGRCIHIEVLPERWLDRTDNIDKKFISKIINQKIKGLRYTLTEHRNYVNRVLKNCDMIVKYDIVNADRSKYKHPYLHLNITMEFSEGR